MQWNSFWNGEYHKSKTNRFNENFAGREALVRWTNELWFRVFHEAGNVDSRFTMNDHDVLFHRDYLENYFLHRPDKSILEGWVRDLRQLQDYCRSHGTALVVIVEAGKPSVYPEDIPRAWRNRYDPRPRTYDLLRSVLGEHGIIFVDGRDVLTGEKSKASAAPLFAKGGIHWNYRGALAVANVAMNRLAEQHKPAHPIEADVIFSNTPEYPDNDLLELMNLAKPWSYPCERIKIKPNTRKGSERPTLAMVGSSFSWELLDVFRESDQFSAIALYFYYTRFKTADERLPPIRRPAAPLDFNREIFAADCLILEIGEPLIAQSQHYLSDFIRDALANLPDPATPKPVFKAD
jgi:hypothetical protein